jgi:hypothetical protein
MAGPGHRRWDTELGDPRDHGRPGRSPPTGSARSSGDAAVQGPWIEIQQSLLRQELAALDERISAARLRQG